MKNTFSFRYDEQTRRRLQKLAEILQRSRSNLIRWLITKEYILRDLNTLEEDGIPSESEKEDLLRRLMEEKGKLEE